MSNGGFYWIPMDSNVSRWIRLDFIGGAMEEPPQSHTKPHGESRQRDCKAGRRRKVNAVAISR